MLRTFIAVDVSPEVLNRASRLIDHCRQLGIDARWVPVENMHITLQFLGNVRENELPLICRSLEKAVRPFPAFDVVCRGVGAFPSIERPRVIWIGVDEGREELIALQGAVEQAMKELGFRGEARRFEAHLTIGRIRSETADAPELAAFVEQNEAYDASVFDVSEVTVYSSHLKRNGPKYEAIGRIALEG